MHAVCARVCVSAWTPMKRSSTAAMHRRGWQAPSWSAPRSRYECECVSVGARTAPLPPTCLVCVERRRGDCEVAARPVEGSHVQEVALVQQQRWHKRNVSGTGGGCTAGRSRRTGDPAVWRRHVRHLLCSKHSQVLGLRMQGGQNLGGRGRHQQRVSAAAAKRPCNGGGEGVMLRASTPQQRRKGWRRADAITSLPSPEPRSTIVVSCPARPPCTVLIWRRAEGSW